MSPIPLKRALLATVTALLTACGGGDSSPAMSVDEQGASRFDASQLAAQLVLYPLSPLSTAESVSLASIREEERLAHDVYAASAQRWSTPIFSNIASSEATHTAAVLSLLDRYQLPDPLKGLPEGQFATPAFQSLHDDLVAASQSSLVDALRVGAQIEELDIRDITEQQAAIDNADILMVYGELLRGSRNHLRAFMKTLAAQGASYTPQYLSQAAFDAIVTSPTETGP